MLLLLHIPYFFFSIKEYTLVVFDEIFNRSLSTHLEHKLADFLKKNEKKNEYKEEKKDSSLKKKDNDHTMILKVPETPASQKNFF